MKPFSELFTNNFFGITFVAFICTQSIVQPIQPAKERTIVIDSESGVVVSCTDGSCNYDEENIIPSTALLCNLAISPLIFRKLKKRIEQI